MALLIGALLTDRSRRRFRRPAPSHVPPCAQGLRPLPWRASGVSRTRAGGNPLTAFASSGTLRDHGALRRYSRVIHAGRAERTAKAIAYAPLASGLFA